MWPHLKVFWRSKDNSTVPGKEGKLKGKEVVDKRRDGKTILKCGRGLDCESTAEAD